MNNKGFLLTDSLIAVSITTSICLLCTLMYGALENYNDVLNIYKREVNERYEEIFSELKECEKCEIIDLDSSLLEQY